MTMYTYRCMRCLTVVYDIHVHRMSPCEPDPASLREWRADGHEQGRHYVETGECICWRCKRERHERVYCEHDAVRGSCPTCKGCRYDDGAEGNPPYCYTHGGYHN